ncbi:cupin [Novosphingobium profundi]|uniref:cupin n=1 Tax=Novosphingobium profundi TaxID=1774954 RepID=UPI001BD98B0A|nr:cupin [Novosphingobium profundi]MBT0667807.1 cupin [Novosphingobium profundi]
MAEAAHELVSNPIHLGLGGRAEVQPPHTGTMEWYEAYAARHVADGAEGRLVSGYEFSCDWDSWEMHPCGDEVVVCTKGEITLIQEKDEGGQVATVLGPGHYAINPAGVWHTADIAQHASVLFITAGKDTRHRPRG